MATTFENVTPSLIPNATMKKRFVDDVHKNYQITPNEGYVLHDNASEFEDNGQIIYQFATGMCSCGASYDFDNTTTILGHTAYGERQFFAMPVDEIPNNAVVYGRITPKPDVMQKESEV